MIVLASFPFKDILLVCDMDGTLLDSKRRISRENQDAIRYFVDGGGLFTIATGRMGFALNQYLPLLPVNAPVILYNGGLIYDFKREEELWQRFLAMEVRTVIEHLMKRFPGMGIEIFHRGDVYFLRENEITREHQERESFIPHRLSLEEIPDPWYKVILVWEHEKLIKVERYIKEQVLKSESTFYTVYSEPYFLEILDRKTSKGEALKELIKILEIPASNVVAVGDNLNDMEMIKAAGTGIAVANAHKELKKAANLCFPHHDEHAVSKVIQWLRDKRKED